MDRNFGNNLGSKRTFPPPVKNSGTNFQAPMSRAQEVNLIRNNSNGAATFPGPKRTISPTNNIPKPKTQTEIPLQKTIAKQPSSFTIRPKVIKQFPLQEPDNPTTRNRAATTTVVSNFRNGTVTHVNVIAMENYSAADSTELSFCKGDIILLRETDLSEWGFGLKLDTGKEGWLPLSHVKSTDPRVQFQAPQSPKIDNQSLVSSRKDSVDRLEKRISNRPTRKELQEANILPLSTESAPSLAAAQKQLERKKTGDFLSNFFRKKDKKKEAKDSLKISKQELNFGDRECTFDDTVEEEFNLTNVSTGKVKWIMEFNSYNLPFVLTFAPPFGTLMKGKEQKVKASVFIKSLANLNLKVKIMTPKGDLIKEFLVKIRCKKGVFGVDPKLLKAAQEDGVTVPSVLVEMRSCIRKYDGFRKEGIFRLSGDITVIQGLKRQVDEQKQFVDTQDVYSIANLIKIFFRELPNPILQGISRETLCDDDVDSALKTVASLPEPQHSLLLWLIGIIQECEQQKDLNKMTIENLAIVIAPNLYQVGDDVPPVEGLLISQKAARFFGACIKGIMQTKSKQGVKESKLSPKLAPSMQKYLPAQRRRSKSMNTLGVSSRAPPPIPQNPKPSVQPKPPPQIKKPLVVVQNIEVGEKRNSFG